MTTRHGSRHQMLRGLFAVGLVLGLAPTSALGANATATWDANTEPDLAGYKLYYGPNQNVYTGDYLTTGDSPIDIPLTKSGFNPASPSLALEGLNSCETVHAALTAYDDDNNESEKCADVAATLVYKPTNLEVEAGANADTVTLSWDKQPADDSGVVSRYVIHYGTTQGGPYDEVDAVTSISGTKLSASFTGVAGNETTYFRIESVCDVSANKIAWRLSDEVYYGTPPPDGGGGGDADTGRVEGGCDCRTVGSGAGLAALMLVGVSFVATRRRRSR